MRKRLYNKYFLLIAVFLLITVSFLKIHSLLNTKDIKDWNYQNLKKINQKAENFSFVVFGDNKNSISTFNNLIDRANKEDALFAIDSGDLVFDGSREKYRFFIDQIARFKKPLLTVIGNHEVADNGKGVYYDYFGRFYYSFTIGNSYFIVLDDSNEKNIDSWQMGWLRDELQKSINYKNKFIFMHVPLYDPREGNLKKGHSLEDLKNAKELNDLFDKYKITMVFASHIHAYYEGKWQNTPYIITGGGGAELTGANPQHDFFHYLKIKVNGDKVTYNVVRLNSPDSEIVDRWVYDAWIYIYAFVAINYLNIILVILLLYLAAYIIFVNERTKINRIWR